MCWHGEDRKSSNSLSRSMPVLARVVVLRVPASDELRPGRRVPVAGEEHQERVPWRQSSSERVELMRDHRLRRPIVHQDDDVLVGIPQPEQSLPDHTDVGLGVLRALDRLLILINTDADQDRILLGGRHSLASRLSEHAQSRIGRLGDHRGSPPTP